MQDIVDLIIKTALKEELVNRNELGQYDYYPDTDRWSNRKMHLVLMNNTFGFKSVPKGQRGFDGNKIIESNFNLKFPTSNI